MDLPEESQKREGEMTVQQAGHLGGEKRFQALGPEGMAQLGHKGGERVKEKYGPEFFEKIGKMSWTANPQSAKVPNISDADRRRAHEIREKIGRGEDLTVEEAGFLGGIARVLQARGESPGEEKQQP